MPSLLGKKWPAPVAQPMAPFYVAGVLVLWGINSTANAIAQSDEYKKDPRNPNREHYSSTAQH